MWPAVQSCSKPALMTVLRNEGRWDRSNVIYEDGRVVLYDKTANASMRYIDYGLSAFHRDLFENIPDKVFELSTLFHNLSLRGDLGGFEVHERFYEIGSPAGLDDLENYLALGVTHHPPPTTHHP